MVVPPKLKQKQQKKLQKKRVLNLKKDTTSENRKTIRFTAGGFFYSAHWK